MAVRLFPFWWLVPPPCPPVCVEQFANPGFETGDFTDWTVDGFTIDEGEHSGDYCAGAGQLQSPAQRKDPSILEQNVSVYVRCLGAEDLFGCYTKLSGCEHGDAFRLEVHYADGSHSELDINSLHDWTYRDLKAILVSGKTISKVKIYFSKGGAPVSARVDDFTLHLT